MKNAYSLSWRSISAWSSTGTWYTLKVNKQDSIINDWHSCLQNVWPLQGNKCSALLFHVAIGIHRMSSILTGYDIDIIKVLNLKAEECDSLCGLSHYDLKSCSAISNIKRTNCSLVLEDQGIQTTECFCTHNQKSIPVHWLTWYGTHWLSLWGQKHLKETFLKYLILCLTELTKSYRFGRVRRTIFLSKLFFKALNSHETPGLWHSLKCVLQKSLLPSHRLAFSTSHLCKVKHFSAFYGCHHLHRSFNNPIIPCKNLPLSFYRASTENACTSPGDQVQIC